MLKQTLILLSIFFSSHLSAQSFKATQQKNERVKTSYSEKWETLKREMTSKKLNSENYEMFIRVFKMDKVLEVWSKSKGDKEFKLFKTYDICSSSGVPGPKRQQGDGQVPEGFYSISVFNPYSNYYLSLGVSYPNDADRKKGKGNPGGDIMIHGNCVTIGCIPLTDTFIKEVYILAVEARNNGQQTIPVHIFSTYLNEKGMKMLTEKFRTDKNLIDFWKNCKPGYDYFENHKQLPKIKIDKEGNYVF